MKTSLEHLPEGKRRELEHVVQIVRDGFEFAVARRTMPRLRNAKLLKIILFESYARGDWVEDPVGRYFSDFDLLVVVNSDELTDVAEFWVKTEERLLEELSAGTKLRTPVSIIYHSLDDVNEKLGLGRYFFAGEQQASVFNGLIWLPDAEGWVSPALHRHAWLTLFPPPDRFSIDESTSSTARPLGLLSTRWRTCTNGLEGVFDARGAWRANVVNEAGCEQLDIVFAPDWLDQRHQYFNPVSHSTVTTRLCSLSRPEASSLAAAHTFAAAE